MTTRATIGKRMICFLLAILMIFSQMTTGIIFAEAETMYSVTIDSNIQNGTVLVDKETAAVGDTVTLTVTPDSGYVLGKLTYTPDGESAQDITETKSFTMPEKNVTVTAEFERDYLKFTSEAAFSISI